MLYCLYALIVFFIVPNIIMIHYLRKKGRLDHRSIIMMTLVFAVIFIPIDMYFVAKGVWAFGSDYMLGVYWLGMPFEEYLFYFTVIPFVALFTEVIAHLRRQFA